jgi:hypothetical protein
MQTELYQTLLDICLERWQYVGNLPGVIRLPRHLKLPPLSEIYRLYLGRSSTRYINSHAYQASEFTRSRSQTIDLFSSEGVVGPSFEHSWNHTQKGFVADSNYSLQPNRERNSFLNELVRLKNMINGAGGLDGTLYEVSSMLSARTRIALAYAGQSVDGILHSSRQKLHPSRPTPLFPV